MNWQEIKWRSRELLSISMPLVVEQTFIMLMGIVSTLLVVSVGEFAVSATGMVDSFSQLVIALFAALTTGGTIVVAQYMGREQPERAKEAAGQAILLSLIFSLSISIFLCVFQKPLLAVLFEKAEPQVMAAANQFMWIVNFSYPFLAVTQTIFGILRGSGDTKAPMAISILMNVTNFLVGYLLIKGIHIGFFSMNSLGISGAAFALLFARFLGFCITSWYLVRGSKNIRLTKWHYFAPNISIQSTILKFGVPTSVESTLFQTGKLLTQIYITGMGIAAMAANTIGGSLFGFINVPGSAFASGLMILVGYRVGRNQTEDVKKTSLFAIVSSMIMLGLLCLLAFVFNEFIIGMYNPTPETYVQLKRIILLTLLATPFFWPMAFVTPAALRATGDVFYTMVASIGGMWLFRIVFGYILGVWLSWGLVGVWCAMYMDWIFRGTFFVGRLLSGKWKGKSIKD